MGYEIVPVSRLNRQQIAGLAGLHRRVMHSLLSDLGLPMVERYYQIACADSSVVGVSALDAEGISRGWAVGSSNPNLLNGRLREARAWFVIHMMRILITRPATLLQALVSARASSMPMKRGAVELTYIGVDEAARGRGLGHELLRAFLDEARRRGFTSVELSVEAGNLSAIALYTGAGFQIVSSFREGAFNRHRMELILE